MKKHYCVTVRGAHSTWGFPITAEPEHVEDWRADGLEVDEIVNSIPEWAQRLGLTHTWFMVQDFWQWMRLW